MDEHKDISERIHAYLEEQLSPEDKLAFEQEMEVNPDLREEVQLQKSAFLLLKHGIREKQRQKVSDLFAEEFPENKPSSGFPWFRVAAAVLLLALAIPIGIWLFGKPGNQDLFANFCSPMEDRITTMSGDHGHVPFYNGLKAYNKEDYPQAIQFFQQVPRGDSLYDYALLYTGNAQLAEGNTEKAKNTFIKIKEEKGGFEAEARTWYLALCHLQLDQPEKAKVYLDQILAKEGPAFQKGKAHELREKLD